MSSAPPLCVYCRQQPSVSRWRPFCSDRCKMADLGRWLKGDYRVSGPATPADEQPRDDADEDPDHV